MSAKINSLGYETDFMFNKFDGSVRDEGHYIVATTDSNPNYFWGNLLLYKRPPMKGDLNRWKSDFQKEFQNSSTYHITLAWDSPEGEKGELKEFVDDGFEFANSVVLTAKEVNLPPKFNDKIDLKIIESEQDFNRCIQVQINSANNKLSKESWESFYTASMNQYKNMIKAGKGLWFGAVLEDKIVGSLGIFFDGNVGRFQIVSTDPEYQRQGVCSTLVYKSAKFMFNKKNLNTLVMVADEDYHAAKVYESVGFIPTEKQVGLCWWDKNKHT